MDEEFGSTFITIEDEDGKSYELELIGDMDYNGKSYVCFLPSEEEMKDDDPDYGYIILRSVTDENGEEVFESIDDDAELNDVYEHFLALLFSDEDEEESPKQ